jgi:hypothetical protein
LWTDAACGAGFTLAGGPVAGIAGEMLCAIASNPMRETMLGQGQ